MPSGSGGNALPAVSRMQMFSYTSKFSNDLFSDSMIRVTWFYLLNTFFCRYLMNKKAKLLVSIFHISRVFSDVQNILSQLVIHGLAFFICFMIKK